MLAGDFTAAEQWRRDVTERVSRLEHWWGLGFEIRASIALVLCEQERYEEAVRLTDVMPTEVGDNAEGHVLWRRGRARALARLGQTDEAIGLARDAVDLADQTDSLNLRGDALLDRADVLRVRAREDEAARDVDAALALYERKGNLVMAERARRLAAESGSKLVGDSGAAQGEEQRLLLE
jgi:tetratricopeptide (TPR) repeat protein